MADKKPSGTKPQTASETEKAKPEEKVAEKVEPVTEPTPVEAPVAVAPPPVRQRHVERQEGTAVPFTHKYPDIRGGVCEFCGILDKNIPSQYQYKLCPHFRGQQLRCSYCPEGRDPDEVIGQSVLRVYNHPDKEDVTVAVCDRYECNKKHQERFSTST